MVCEQDENGLVAAAKSGNPTAFNDLLQLQAESLLRTAYRITRNREDAEDALQDSFLKAFLHFEQFDGRSSFSTWLTRIAINSALMVVRKRRSALGLPIEASGCDEDLRLTEVPDQAPNPEAYLVRREQEGILRAAIRSLRPTIRKAVELQKLQERSLKETAEMMGLSVAAAKARVFQAKAVLRKSLAAKGGPRTRARRMLTFATAA
jgi:RNA polymerase sigma-70 factor (ECF subfamily)